MAAATILDFHKFEILTVHDHGLYTVGANMGHHAKFHQNHQNFINLIFFNGKSGAKFRKDRKNSCKVQQSFDFCNMSLSK